MRKYDMLERALTGEPVEATDDILELAALAEEVESIFTANEPTAAASRRGMRTALEAFREAAPRPLAPSRTRRIAARALVAAAMLVALPSVGWAASENALPGDLLYPVKRGFEQIRLAVASSPMDRATVELDIAAERLGEAARARALGLDEAVRAAVAGYAEAMVGFERSIAEARSNGTDVTALLAVARELVERHEELLDALRGNGTPAGTNPVVAAAPGHPDGDQASQAARGKANGKGKGKVEGKGKANDGRGGSGPEKDRDGQAKGRSDSKDPRGDRGGTEEIVVPPAPDEPGRAEGAPHGEAEGHSRNGSPPQGSAGGHGKNADPPSL